MSDLRAAVCAVFQDLCHSQTTNEAAELHANIRAYQQPSLFGDIRHLCGLTQSYLVLKSLGWGQECKQLLHCSWSPAGSKTGDKLEQFIEHAWKLGWKKWWGKWDIATEAARRTSAFSGLYRLPWYPGNRIPAVSPFARFYLPEVCCKTHKACEPIMEIDVKEARNSLGDDGSHFLAWLEALPWNTTGWTAVYIYMCWKSSPGVTA